jgi:hypothetical protein
MAEKKDDEWLEMTQRFELRISPSLLSVVDDWRRKQQDLPTRAEAVRRMVLLAAQLEGTGKAKAGKAKAK